MRSSLFPDLKVLKDEDQEVLNAKTSEKVALLESSLAAEEELLNKRQSGVAGYEREDLLYKWVPAYCTLKDFDPWVLL